MRYAKFAALALAVLLLAGCGSKIKGKWASSFLGIEVGYVFGDDGKVTMFFPDGEVGGTYTFDEATNSGELTLDDGTRATFSYSPTTNRLNLTEHGATKGDDFHRSLEKK